MPSTPKIFLLWIPFLVRLLSWRVETQERAEYAQCGGRCTQETWASLDTCKLASARVGTDSQGTILAVYTVLTVNEAHTAFSCSIVAHV